MIDLVLILQSLPIIKEGEGGDILRLNEFMFTSVKTAVKANGMGHTWSSPDLFSNDDKQRQALRC